MTRMLIGWIAAAILMGAAAASAAQPEPFTSATATWTDAGHVALTVTWSGGACEKAGEATVDATEANETIDAVTIPTVSTAEVCTMQMVPVEYVGQVAVEPLTRVLSITVLAPDGQPRAGGSVVIMRADN